MRKFLLILVIIMIPFKVLGQKYSLDNTLGLNYSGTTNSLTASALLQNSVTVKKLDFTSNIDYGFSATQENISNSLLSKTSCNLQRGKALYFVTVQNNFTRNVDMNLFGAGLGRSDTLKTLPYKLTYGLLYQYMNEPFVRHSLRLKTSKKVSRTTGALEVFYQPNVADPSDYIVYSSFKLSYNLGNFSVSLNDVYNFHSKRLLNTVHIVTLGIAYERKS